MGFQDKIWPGYKQYYQYLRLKHPNMLTLDLNNWYREDFTVIYQICRNNFQSSSSIMQIYFCQELRRPNLEEASSDENTISIHRFFLVSMS